MRVLVVGGGIGGLCLAQGLRKAGVGDVAVYERDPSPRGRMQGYRLRVSPEGEEALRTCLPEPATRLLVATSHERHEAGLAAYDEQLRPQWAPSFDDPRADTADRVDAVDRATLRHVLTSGIQDALHYGREVVRCEPRPDRVVVHFADGTTDTGDVLVAADGAHSRVREQLGPASTVRDLGVRTVLSRTPRARAIEAGLPEVLRDRFVYVMGSDGHHLGLMPMVFRTRPPVAAERLGSEVRLDAAEDYYMSVFNVHRETLGIPDRAFFRMGGDDLRALALERTAAWHPQLRGIFAHAEPAETHPVAMRVALPVRPWGLDRVVPLGDAVHLMPPSGGVGANTAARDAAALSRALAAVTRGGTPLATALRRYEEDMCAYATEAARMSVRIAQWSLRQTDLPAA